MHHRIHYALNNSCCQVSSSSLLMAAHCLQALNNKNWNPITLLHQLGREKKNCANPYIFLCILYDSDTYGSRRLYFCKFISFSSSYVKAVVSLRKNYKCVIIGTTELVHMGMLYFTPADWRITEPPHLPTAYALFNIIFSRLFHGTGHSFLSRFSLSTSSRR